MRHEPELLVPISEAREVQPAPAPRPRGMSVLGRLWFALGALVVGFLGVNALLGPEPLVMLQMALTALAVWGIVAWIFSPVFHNLDQQR